MEASNPDKISEYEEEQLQQILLQESEKQKINMDRELRESQNKEYLECCKQDMKTNKETHNSITKQESSESSDKEIDIEEIDIEEMRRIRLLRFKPKQ